LADVGRAYCENPLPMRAALESMDESRNFDLF
jgi:hypothetical protein